MTHAEQSRADRRVLIISPVRNEAAHIDAVVAAVAAQSLAPAKWIVIDDGSSDDTLARLQRLATALPFMEVLSQTRVEPATSVEPVVPRDRLAVGAAPRNFNAGLKLVDWRAYSHVMKLDGDIELPPSYLDELLDRFEADPELGLAGGVLVEPSPDGGLRAIPIPRQHVHGALKLYSRACFEAIGGVQQRLGWDTIDETYARMRGYRTLSFPDLVSIHHRPLGSADGVLRGRARHGQCAYIVHYPLDWVALRSLKIAIVYRPRVLSGLAFLYGYLRAGIRKVEQVPDPEYRLFTRAELRRRLAPRAAWGAVRGRMFGSGPHGSSARVQARL